MTAPRAWNSTFPARTKGLARTSLRAATRPPEEPTGWPAGTGKPPSARSRGCRQRYADEDSAALAARWKAEAKGGRWLPAYCPHGCQGWHVVSRRTAVLTVRGQPVQDTVPSARTRALVLERDSYACVCCGRSIIGHRYSLGHRLRASQGGKAVASNLITLLGWGGELCHGRIDNRADPQDEIKGFTVRSGQDPALVPVKFFERSGSWIVAYLADDGGLLFEGPEGGRGAALRRQQRGGRPSRCQTTAPHVAERATAHTSRGRHLGGVHGGLLRDLDGGASRRCGLQRHLRGPARAGRGGGLAMAAAKTGTRRKPAMALTLGLVPRGGDILAGHPEWAHLATPGTAGTPPAIVTDDARREWVAAAAAPRATQADFLAAGYADYPRAWDTVMRPRPLPVASARELDRLAMTGAGFMTYAPAHAETPAADEAAGEAAETTVLAVPPEKEETPDDQ